MSIELTPLRFRLELDMYVRTPVNDKLTGALPYSWNGLDIDFEFALLRAGDFIDAKTVIDTMYMNIHAGNRDSQPLITKTLAPSAIDTACTRELWDADDATHGKHGTFSLTAAEAIFSMAAASAWKIQLWVAFYTEMTTGKYVTNGVTQWTVEEDTEQTGLAPTGTILTNMRTTPDGKTQFKDPDTGLWHTQWAKNGMGIMEPGVA